MSVKENFIKKIAPMAMQTQIDYGVPASITIAQAGLESRWGESKLSKMANNYFGIRAIGNWIGEVFNIDTGEYIDGNYVIDKLASFRSYPDMKGSFTDHAEFLLKNKRYKSLFDSEDGNAWADGLQKARYATAPNYADTLKTIIRQNNLKAYDKKALEKATTTSTLKKHYRRNRTLFAIGGGLVVVGLSFYAYNRYKRKVA